MDSATIIKYAKSHLGETETPNNSGFKNKVFEKLMITLGSWSKGESWCARYCKLVWKEAYANDKEKLITIDKLFSGSAITTFNNAKKLGLKTLYQPEVGALVVWKHGNSTWQGHIGIVTKIVNTTTYLSIEGNGSIDGSREGTTVVEKSRKFTYILGNGLNLVGFIQAI